MCDGAEHRARGNPGSLWRNLRENDLPLPRRVRLFAGNSWWKVRNRQGCCGHYGDPGC